MKKTISALLVVGLLSGCGSSANSGSSGTIGTSSSSVMLQSGSYTDNVNGSAAADAVYLTTAPAQGGNFTFTYSEPVTADGTYYPGTTTYNVTLGSGSTEYSGFFYVTSQTSDSPCWVYDFDPNKHMLYLGQSTMGSSAQSGCNVSVNYSIPYIQT